MNKAEFMVLAKPCNQPFVVDGSKIKEFNKKRMPKKVLEEIQKRAGTINLDNISVNPKVFSKQIKK